ncbi:uncharacterized protein Dana_GF16097 [Drosophila ananassae]|uniref:Uncharacterized protein n=1 Tax=Drosophila ananassae TaxID=7217 RepID=B3M0N8_DROAN|nr:uncharacterized protein LOC6498894 [Drosophila ananassae]EDV44285.2 uncharacterized protein Dana_GF16097 [Drosophila ananassae]
MASFWLVSAFFGAFVLFSLDCNDAVEFKFTNFVCESYNKSWFTFSHCRLKAINRDKIVLNMNGTLHYPAYRIKIHGKLFKKANGYKPWLYERTVDACKFMLHKSDPLVSVLYNLMKDFTNINHSCPYVGPQIIKDFYLKPELMRVPVPTGEYLLALKWYLDAKPQFGTNFSASFVEDILAKKN